MSFNQATFDAKVQESKDEHNLGNYGTALTKAEEACALCTPLDTTAARIAHKEALYLIRRQKMMVRVYGS